MTPEAFFENFAYMADAPNGVEKLRELILQLAVRGKLVSQDPNDEPAIKLLERIRIEKARLVKEKKIRKSDPLPPVTFDESLFELPDGWQWVRLREISRDWGQKVPDKRFTYIDVSSVDNAMGIIAQPTVLEPEEAPSRARKLVQTGTVIYSTVRPYLLNIAVIKESIKPEPIASTAFAILHPLGNISDKYLFWWLRSPDFIAFVESKMLGVAYPAINDAQFFSGLLPLPPIAEQHRIVAKVDQLMAFCAELETRQQNEKKKLTRLNNSALNQLTSSSEENEFTEAWQLVTDNFDILYTTPDTIAKLRQSILQLAVQGKLVPQDPNDEPASLLLCTIKAEKERLTKEKNIRKSAPLPQVNPDEMPFELPLGWECQRFAELAEIVGGVTKGRNLAGRKTELYPYLRVANVQRGFLDLNIMKDIEIPLEELEKYRLCDGDLLITEGGDWDKVGRTAIWANQIEDCIHQNHVFRVRTFNDELNRFWLMQYLNSSIGRRYFEKASKQTTNLASINMTQLRNCPIPIPPAAEQLRIVSVVNKFMALCDTLEAKLTKTYSKAEKLTSAAIHELLAA